MDSDQKFLITITKSLRTQGDLHNYLVIEFPDSIIITQQELHKSGDPHFHVYMKCPATIDVVRNLVDKFNPPINKRTNDVIIPDSDPGAIKYVTKDKLKNKPLYYGITEKECDKIVNKYKNRRDKSDIVVARIRRGVICTELNSVYQKMELERKQLLSNLKDRIDKCKEQLMLFQEIGDFDAIDYCLRLLQDLRDQRATVAFSVDERFQDFLKLYRQLYIPINA